MIFFILCIIFVLFFKWNFFFEISRKLNNHAVSYEKIVVETPSPKLLDLIIYFLIFEFFLTS
jgi:hypothetical protein